jgi:hypothetical protein
MRYSLRKICQQIKYHRWEQIRTATNKHPDEVEEEVIELLLLLLQLHLDACWLLYVFVPICGTWFADIFSLDMSANQVPQMGTNTYSNQQASRWSWRRSNRTRSNIHYATQSITEITKTFAKLQEFGKSQKNFKTDNVLKHSLRKICQQIKYHRWEQIRTATNKHPDEVEEEVIICGTWFADIFSLDYATQSITEITKTFAKLQEFGKQIKYHRWEQIRTATNKHPDEVEEEVIEPEVISSSGCLLVAVRICSHLWYLICWHIFLRLCDAEHYGLPN